MDSLTTFPFRAYLNDLSNRASLRWGTPLNLIPGYEPQTFRLCMLHTLGYSREIPSDYLSDAQDCYSSLSRLGYYFPPYVLEPELLHAVLNVSHKLTLSYHNRQLPDKQSLSFLSQVFLGYISNNSLIAPIRRYLGCTRPFISHPYVTFSDSFNDQSSDVMQRSQKAYYYHRDIDSLKSVKIFVSLCPYDADGGDHYFVSGSHIPPQAQDLSSPLRTNMEAFWKPYHASSLLETYENCRFTDESIHSLYGHSSILKIPLQFCRLWIEDTFGLHKGSDLRRGQRILLGFIVSKAPLG